MFSVMINKNNNNKNNNDNNNKNNNNKNNNNKNNNNNKKNNNKKIIITHNNIYIYMNITFDVKNILNFNLFVYT